MDVVPYRVGVPKSAQSGLEKFEGFAASTAQLSVCFANRYVARIRMSGVDEATLYLTQMRAVLSIARAIYTTWVGKKVCSSIRSRQSSADTLHQGRIVMISSNMSRSTTGAMDQSAWRATHGLASLSTGRRCNTHLR